MYLRDYADEAEMRQRIGHFPEGLNMQKGVHSLLDCQTLGELEAA